MKKNRNSKSHNNHKNHKHSNYKNNRDNKKINPLLNDIKKFWKFIWYDDSILSYILNLFVAYLFIKFLFFPALGFVLNNDYPVVAIVSGSMEHKIVDHKICDKYITNIKSKNLDHTTWWNLCGPYYEKIFNLTDTNFSNFDYLNGLNIGDVMILYGKKPKDIQIGEILVFIPQDKTFFKNYGPVIHRVVKKWVDKNGKYHFQTKGDHNQESYNNFESDITEDKIIAVSIARIPYLGYPKKLGYDLVKYIKNNY